MTGIGAQGHFVSRTRVRLLLGVFQILIWCAHSPVEAGSGGAHPPAGTLVARDPDSSAKNVDLEVAENDAAPFAAEARRIGIAVSAEEVQRRCETYRAMYPGRVVEASRVNAILLAEKYLERKGFLADETGPEGKSEGGKDAGRFAAPEQADPAGRAESLHRMLAREDMRSEAEKLESYARLRTASDPEPAGMWSQSDLQVLGDPEECLAWTGKDCLVPVSEYNAATAYYPMPNSMPLNSAKEILFKRYLSEKRLALEARDRGLDRKADSILPRLRLELDNYRWIQSTLPMGNPVRDMKLLEAAYDKYYGRYFGPRQEATVAVIGSSDSAYIDSLYSTFDSWRRKCGAGGKRFPTLPKEPDLPWSYFKDRQLPEELAALANGLKPGECRAPFPSRTGHFLVRLVRIFPIREIPFQEAFLHVVYLATRDRFLEMDSVVEAQARKYYSANLAQFALPDTMELNAWLIPRPEARPAVRKAGQGKASVLPDTSRFKAMGVSSLALPDDLRIKLMARMDQDSTRSFFGPVPDRFGRWYFRVRSRKRASGAIPYRLARKEILARIAAPLENEGSGTASDEAENEVGGYLALARALKQSEFRMRMEGRNGTRIPERDTEGPRPSGQSESEAAGSPEEAAERIRSDEDRRRADEVRMLREARVDLNRLFRN